MKFFSKLLAVLLAVSYFCITPGFAQKSVKPKKVVIVDFLLLNGERASKWKIPINKTRRGGLKVGGGSVTECASPNSDCSKAIYSSYEFEAKAFAIGKNRTRIDIKIEYSVDEKECKTRRIFTVYRNRQTKIRLGCGAVLIARYGLETEETD